MIEFETRPSKKTITSWLATPLLFLALGVAMAALAPRDTLFGVDAVMAAGLIGGSLLSAASIALWARRVRFRVTQEQIALEYSLRRVARVRSTIVGGRPIEGGVRLDFRDQKPLLVPAWALRSQAAQRWLKTLTNLDAIETAAEWDDLDHDARFGRTVPERRRTYEKWARLLHLMGWAPLVFGLWAISFPRPYVVAVATAGVMPILAFVVVGLSRGRVTFAGIPGRHLGLQVLAFLIGGTALGVRGVLDFHLIDWGHALIFAALLAGAFVALAAGIDRNVRRPWIAVFVGVILFAWVWGASVVGNGLLGRGDVILSPVEVVGRNGSAADEPGLRVRMPDGAHREARIARRTFEAAGRGEFTCVAVRKGAFRWRHFRIVQCPPTDGRIPVIIPN